MFFNDKNGQPYSLMAATMNLQDKYDLLLYCRDNLIATSGTVGDWIDIAHLPVVLGVSMPERIMKWLAYKKNGKVFVRSGAGIVADSVPETEHQESLNKAQAVVNAIKAANEM